MTKSITVTKKEIIKALRTEKLLKAGTFIEKNPLGEVCNVCAVGAILRSKGLNYDQIDTYGSNLSFNNVEGVCGDGGMKEILGLVNKGRYMAALSSFYEYTSERIRQRQSWGCTIPYYLNSRSNSIEFVKTYFPDKLKIIL